MGQNKNSEEIHKLYKELAKRYHPDFAKDERDKEFRTKLFIKIKKAYDKNDIETMKNFVI